MTYIIITNIIYDLYKIFKKKNVSWREAYDNKYIYGYSDLIKELWNKINLLDIILFLIIIKIIKIIILIQIIIFITFIIKLKLTKKEKKNLKRGTLRDIFINNPKIYAIKIHSLLKFKNIKLLISKKIIKNIIININNIIIWGYPKIVIDYTIITTKYIKNWIKKNPKKKDLKEIQILIKNLIKNNFTETINRFQQETN